ncbi:hypothetical protein GDO81_029309 [Engystomops pustulosus]|uniref:Uncharacterized protein n=1 Tax=Engystomops pustulosus TaxID=76066 RepID=A0AAV6YDS0_ENGPU|nr:hypothetical protein GDO81_029309 [Engystomops pustulosus]
MCVYGVFFGHFQYGGTSHRRRRSEISHHKSRSNGSRSPESARGRPAELWATLLRTPGRGSSARERKVRGDTRHLLHISWIREDGRRACAPGRLLTGYSPGPRRLHVGCRMLSCKEERKP